MKASKRKTKKSIRDYQTLAFTMLTVAFFGFFAVRPSVTLIVELFHERTLYTEVDKQLEDKIQQIINLQADYMSLLSKKQLIDSAIPAAPNLKELEVLADPKIGLNTFGIAELQLKPPLTIGLQTVPVTVGGKGSYTTLSDYFHTMYVLPRLLYMKNVDIGKVDAASDSAVLQFTVKVNAFYFIDQ